MPFNGISTVIGIEISTQYLHYFLTQSFGTYLVRWAGTVSNLRFVLKTKQSFENSKNKRMHSWFVKFNIN